MNPGTKILEVGIASWLREDLNSSGVLPFVEVALNVIRENPELEPEFIEAFEKIISEGGDPELVEVCAHVLRWPALRKRFAHLYNDAVQRNDWRTAPVFLHIVEACEESWANDTKDYYGDFFSKWAAI